MKAQNMKVVDEFNYLTVFLKKKGNGENKKR